MIRVTLCWAMLLPLGSVWSLDRHFSNQKESSESTGPISRTVTSLAGIGLIIQMACVYFFTALMKDSPRWREDGSALYYALGGREVTTGFGNWLFHNAPGWLLQSLTHATLILEFAAPMLILLPLSRGWLRSVGVFSIVALHLGIMLTLEVGLFPYISIAAIVGILPRSFWESSFIRTVFAVRLPAVWTKFAGIVDGMLRPAGAQDAPVPVSSSTSRPVDNTGGHVMHFSFSPYNSSAAPGVMLANLIAAVMIVVVLAWNVQTVSAYVVPQPVRVTAISTGMYQTWSMFAPGPKTSTVWYVVDGQLASGEVVDLYGPLQNGNTEIREPLPIDQSDNIEIQDKYWRKYFDSIRDEGLEKQRFAAFICRSWNADHKKENRLERVTFHRGIAITLPNSERAQPDYDQLGSWRCL